MKSLEELQCLSQEQIEKCRTEVQEIIQSINKSEINSIKSMILPPMFTFNILKLVLLIQNPKIPQKQITWQKIKKDILFSSQILQRRCQNIKIDEHQQEDIEFIQDNFRQIFKDLSNIQSKSELYGTLVHKMCKYCLRMRTIIHGSKFLRSQD